MAFRTDNGKQQLAVVEVRNQQLLEQLVHANAPLTDLDKKNPENIGKLQQAAETGQRLESRLTAAQAVVVSYQGFFAKLTSLPSPPANNANTSKNRVGNQNLLFNPGE